MCIVHLRIQCSDPFSKALISDVKHTELTIESLVSTALLEAFDTVLIDAVTIQHSTECDNENKERDESNVECEM